jgi:hypothetical protein
MRYRELRAAVSPYIHGDDADNQITNVISLLIILSVVRLNSQFSQKLRAAATPPSRATLKAPVIKGAAIPVLLTVDTLLVASVP